MERTRPWRELKTSRSLQRGTSHRELVDVNEINRETAALLRDEAARYNISVRAVLAPDLPTSWEIGCNCRGDLGL
jgi:hypothetical protein